MRLNGRFGVVDWISHWFHFRFYLWHNFTSVAMVWRATGQLWNEMSKFHPPACSLPKPISLNSISAVMASLQVLSGLLMIIKGIFSTSFFCLLLWSAACKKQEHNRSMMKKLDYHKYESGKDFIHSENCHIWLMLICSFNQILNVLCKLIRRKSWQLIDLRHQPT